MELSRARLTNKTALAFGRTDSQSPTGWLVRRDKRRWGLSLTPTGRSLEIFMDARVEEMHIYMHLHASFRDLYITSRASGYTYVLLTSWSAGQLATYRESDGWQLTDTKVEGLT